MGGRLPNLLVAGVPKAGTGSLFAYLTQHPDICGGDKKEVGYFNHYNPLRYSGEIPHVDRYRAHFAHCSAERYVVDGTPTYSYGGAPIIAAIQQVLGSPRIIISLRDPVERLWSAYTFQRSLGNIRGLPTFVAYLRACEAQRRDGTDLAPRDHRHGLYIGFYDDYIGLWLDAFGDDLKIVFAEDLARDAAAVLTDLFGWLRVDPAPLAAMDLERRNLTVHPRSTSVAKLVFSVKRSTDRWGLLHAAIRRPLRHAYERVNAGHLHERFDETTRRHVEEIYRESTRATAKLLASHGYRNLPDWLQAGSDD